MNIPEQRRRTWKDWGKSALRDVFEVGQRLGVDVLPRHFYSEIPDIRALRHDQSWRRPYTMKSVAGTDLEQQLAWLKGICPDEVTSTLSPGALQLDAGRANGAIGYGPVEADLLFCLVTAASPRRMIQIGAGASTWVALEAARRAAADLEIICVDPYPTDYLRALGAAGEIELVDAPVQSVAPEVLAALGPGDVFFVDSTHTVSPGSDVNYIVLEVLPRLPKGVLVHFHDITMPYDYLPSLLARDIFFWSESVLLHAYLADNPRYEVRAACAMLHHAAPSRLAAILPTYDRPLPTADGLAVGDGSGMFPSSLWLEVVGHPR